MTAGRAAVFLDRDGTIIRDVRYIGRPEDVELLPGAANAIRLLNDAGLPTIIVTNQSAIGRGYHTLSQFQCVQARVEEALSEGGVQIDGVYLCPHAPHSDGEPMCECRKPGTALFLRASQEHGIDPARSWYLGDRWRDIQPAISLGGHGILIPGPETPPEEVALARSRAVVAQSLREAANAILESQATKP